MKTEPSRETGSHSRRTILTFAAVVEIATGLALMADPAVVVRLLLGAEVSGIGLLLGRFFGIALLALGIACWPSMQRSDNDPPPFRAMLTYNALVALYLAYLGTAGHLQGLLLWPAMALHAIVALLLVWTWLRRNRARA
jgi:Ca2+/Na+ antiporter